MYRICFFLITIVFLPSLIFAQAETQNPNTAAGLYWRVRGNLGTDTFNHFLGTLDASNLTFRTNNIRRMTIDVGGRVGIGTTLPNTTSMLEVVNTLNTNPVIVSTNYGNPNEFWFRRAQGTISAPSLIGANGVLGRIDGRGYDGSAFLHATRIEMLVDSVSSAGVMPGRIVFSTAPVGAAPIERMRITRNGLVGINTIAPATTLDINGDIALRQATLTLVNGANHNVVVNPFPSGHTYYRITGPTAAFNITGFTAAGATDGRVLILQNATTQIMTLTDQSTLSSTSNRIMTGGGNLSIGDSGTVTLIYSAGDNRWQVQSFSNGILANSTFGNNWTTLGNSGTNPATNFIGTTDNADFLIKRQNEEALRVYTGGALVAVGNNFTGVVPVSGFGTRMVWAPGKSAFRAGSVSGIQWDDANVGPGSAAFGANNTASGFYSFASGFNNTATNTYAVAFGNANTASGFNSAVFGNANTTSGQTSSAFGFQNVASATNSFVTGQQDTTLGVASSAFGTGNRAASFNEMALGMYGTIYTAGSTSAHNATDRIFNVGIGTSANARADAITIFKSGNIRVPGLATGGPFVAAPSAATDKIMYADANGDLRAMTAGTTGQVLTYTASGPAWGAVTSANAWNITGNVGTVDGTNFIGTTDDIPFNIRVNNLRAGRIDNTNANAFFGFQAGNAANLSTSNSFFGHQAGFSTTTATENSFFGRNSGFFNTTGSRNAFYGNGSGFQNTDGYANTFIGEQAGRSNTTGFSNVAVGTRALFSSTTGSNLVAVGDSALRVNTSGGNNTAIGSKTLSSNTTGSGNTAVGRVALRNNTGGSANTAVGTSSLASNTTGNSNTALGAATLSSNTTGSNNVALGPGTLINNTTGSSNVAVGINALTSVISTSNLVAVGDSALRANTSGAMNSALGSKALESNTTGEANTAAGSGALRFNTTGTNNVGMGTNSGLNNATGSRNTLVGALADVLASNLNDATAIGASAKVSAGNNLILGDTVGRPQVGIGVTAVGKTLANTRFEIASESTLDNLLYRYSGNGSPAFNFQRSAGTLASPTAVINGNTLGSINFSGYDGSDWGLSTAIYAEVDSVVNTSIIPSRLRFLTQSGNGLFAERMRITRNGNVVIADAADRNTKLYVDGGVSIEPPSIIALTVDNQVVNVGDESYLRLSSNTTAGTTRTVYLGNGLEVGQILIISSASTGTNQFELVDVDTDPSTNMETGSASLLMDPKDTATFIWDGTDWLMLSFRSNN